METRSSITRVGLIPAQRHGEILDILKADGTASVQQLAAHIGASVSTIRRDLEVLEEAGFLDRSFGGASLRPRAIATLETGQAVASHIQRREKAAIARVAAGFIQPHQALILDSGSTVAELARVIAEDPPSLTVITNDLLIGQTLSDSPRIRLVVTGGTVRPGSSTLLGSPGEELLATTRADIAFIGAHAITEHGISETSLEIVRIKQAIIRAARRVVILADHSKFGDPSVFHVERLPPGCTIVTDPGADLGMLERLREDGIEILIAPSDAAGA